MVALGLVYKAGALRLGIISLLAAGLSSAIVEVPTFPHLDPRFETLNISSENEVQNLVNDWQLELDAWVGPGGQAAIAPPAGVGRFASPLLAERAICLSIAPVGCEYLGISYCCYSTTTCCYTEWCCYPGFTCCNSNPGLCCGEGTFCCNSQTCCANGSTCVDGVCANPILYLTITITSYSTQYATAFQTIFNSVTSTIESTVSSTEVVTVSTVGTATSVSYVTSTTTTTITPAAKRTVDAGAPMTSLIPLVASVAEDPLGLGYRKVFIKTDRRLDILAEKLAKRGLVVERAITSTVYETAYAEVTAFYTSVISSAHVAYVTDIVTNVVTITSFDNAQTTVQVVSTTIVTVTVTGSSPGGETTPGPESHTDVIVSPSDSSPSGIITPSESSPGAIVTPSESSPGVIVTPSGSTPGGFVSPSGGSIGGIVTVSGGITVTVSESKTGGRESVTTTGGGSKTSSPSPVSHTTGLSTGAKAGIGVGAGLGAVAIAALIFFLGWWRRSKKDKDTTNASPAGISQPVVYMDPGTTHYGPPKELAAVGAAHHVPHPSNGSNTVEPVSPTSTDAWQQPTDYQQPYQRYPAYTPPPGYGYGAPSPPPQGHDPRAASPQSFQGGYPQNMAEMQGQHPTELGQYGNYHPQAHEMPGNQPIRPYESR